MESRSVLPHVVALTLPETLLAGAVGATIGAVIGGLVAFYNARRLEDRKERRRSDQRRLIVATASSFAMVDAIMGLVRAKHSEHWWPVRAPLATLPVADLVAMGNPEDEELFISVSLGVATINGLNRRAALADGGRMDHTDQLRVDEAVRTLLHSLYLIDDLALDDHLPRFAFEEDASLNSEIRDAAKDVRTRLKSGRRPILIGSEGAD